jgi:hypothetical protein
MIHPDIQQAVLECKGKMSQQAISARFHISRQTVRSILRRGYVKYQPLGCTEYDIAENKESKEYTLKAGWTGAVERCHKCGRLVQLPCLACRIEEMAKRKRGVLV